MLPEIQASAPHRLTLPTEHWVEGVVYSVCGDESHEGKADVVYVVSGLFGNDEDWGAVKSAWLAITKGEEFHASEWSKRVEYGSLCRVICNSNLIAFAAGMDLSEYESVFPNPVEQLPYYFCFSKVVEHLVSIASGCLPSDKVEFTFDRNFEVKHNATYLYDCMIKVPEFEHWELLADKISFATRKDPGIQMADMVARESMKWLMTVVQGANAIRSTCLAGLTDSHRLHWHHFHKDYFVQRVAHVQKLIDEGHPVGNYEQWRARKGCQDTTENRIRYQVQITKMLRAESE
jgi:hypothetical protein